MGKWTIEDSKELYNIKGWGVDYFGINAKGNAYVQPCKGKSKIDLKELVEELYVNDTKAPILLRFPDILNNRIEETANCFDEAAKSYDFKADSYIIYPIKVNQMRPVVEEIISHGKKYNLGLEAGSRPELHAVLAINMESDSLIICNGHKDHSFIELALMAQKMGKRVFIVIEKLNELTTIAKIAKKLNVHPNLGIRIKLASSGAGKWEESGGDASKFGLNPSELLSAIKMLKDLHLEDCFKLIHFHIGSQVTRIRRIQTALREASQYYIQLQEMGFNIEFVDCGGGLGVDYDGTRSANSESSINYTIQEYINDCVYTFVDAANKKGMPHPNIITEGGRSLTAHHSVLILDVMEGTRLPQLPDDWSSNEGDHQLVHELEDIWDKLTPLSMLEDWHDAEQIRDEALELFNHGLIDLKTRAHIESLYWSITRDVNIASKKMKHMPDELKRLDKILAEKYYCNFSLFQSMPDSWGIDQLFPIIPIQRLNEKPTVNVTLQDITCDSDGKVTTYINAGSQSDYITMHELRKDEHYFIGVFLVGAYQEILGNMHNLFGDTNAVHVSIDDDGYKITKIIDGETVSEVLEYVQYDSKKLVRRLEIWEARAVKEKRITSEEGKEFLNTYRSGLYGYTYLEDK